MTGTIIWGYHDQISNQQLTTSWKPPFRPVWISPKIVRAPQDLGRILCCSFPLATVPCRFLLCLSPPKKNIKIWRKACLGHKMTQIRWDMFGMCMVYRIRIKWISLYFQSPCFMYDHNFNHTLRPTYENEGHEHDMSTLLTVLICSLTAKDTSKVKVDGDQQVVSVTVMNQTCILTYIYSSACHA